MKTKPIFYSLVFIISLFVISSQLTTCFNNGIEIESISLKNSKHESWAKIWIGGTYSEGKNIVLDSKGNILVHGRYGYDNIIVKYNNLGEELWNQPYGDVWSWLSNYHGKDIAVDSEDNIYLVGSVSGWGNMPDCFLVKFNDNGEIQWEHKWDSEEILTYGIGVSLDSDDNIYVIGHVNESTDGTYGLFLLKYNQSGDLQWNKSYEEYGAEYIYDIEIDELNNIYMSGCMNSTPNNYDMLMLKYNSSGILQWNETWGGDTNDRGIKIAFDSQDNIVIWGESENFGDKNTIVVKIDSSGNLLWNKSLGNKIYDDFALDSADNLFFAKEGDFYPDDGTEISLVEYNKTGDFITELIWGTLENDEIGEILIDSSNNTYIVGGSGSNMFIVCNPIDIESSYPPIISFGLFSLIFATIGIIYIYLKVKHIFKD